MSAFFGVLRRPIPCVMPFALALLFAAPLRASGQATALESPVGRAGPPLPSGLAHAQTPESADPRIRAGLTYLRTLYSFDFEAVRQRLADDVRFRDVTATALGGPPFAADGKDDFIEFAQRSSVGSSNLYFEVARAFAADDWVVLWLTYYFDVTAEALAMEGGGFVTLHLAATTALRLDGDQVLEHRDFVDYEGMNALIERTRRGREGR